MKLKEQNILFFTRTMKLGGTENVILQLCEILRPCVNKIVVCSCGGVNVEKLAAMGITHYEIPDIENKSPKTILSVLRIVKRIIKEEAITMVHTHHRMAAFYIRLIGPSGKFIFVSTAHGIFNDKKKLTKYCYKGSNIIACGNVVRDNLVNDYGINPEQVTVICNAVEKDDSDIVPVNLIAEQRKRNKKIISYIGRLSEEKGISDLIKTIRIVVSESDTAVFAIVGDGPMKEEVASFIGKNGFGERVFMLGYRNDAQNIMKQTDIVIMPSLTEGLPLTPLEAFAHGKPVVATKAGGTTEIVSDGENGILVEIGDYNGLAEGIVKLINTPELYREYSVNAEKRYEERYIFDLFKDRIIAFYTQLIEGKAKQND